MHTLMHIYSFIKLGTWNLEFRPGTSTNYHGPLGDFTCLVDRKPILGLRLSQFPSKSNELPIHGYRKCFVTKKLHNFLCHKLWNQHCYLKKTICEGKWIIWDIEITKMILLGFLWSIIWLFSQLFEQIYQNSLTKRSPWTDMVCYLWLYALISPVKSEQLNAKNLKKHLFSQIGSWRHVICATML